MDKYEKMIKKMKGFAWIFSTILLVWALYIVPNATGWFIDSGDWNSAPSVSFGYSFISIITVGLYGFAGLYSMDVEP